LTGREITQEKSGRILCGAPLVTAQH
jgi:hypothetical protein